MTKSDPARNRPRRPRKLLFVVLSQQVKSDLHRSSAGLLTILVSCLSFPSVTPSWLSDRPSHSTTSFSASVLFVLPARTHAIRGPRRWPMTSGRQYAAPPWPCLRTRTLPTTNVNERPLQLVTTEAHVYAVIYPAISWAVLQFRHFG